MKAVVYTKYGSPDVLEQTEIDIPICDKNEVLVKVNATTVTPMDWKFRSGSDFAARLVSGLISPNNNILGAEFSGEIYCTGRDVNKFALGDRVFGRALDGTYAEYICVDSDDIALIPSNISDEEAAGATFGGTTSLHFLKKLGNIKEGDQVLINGASGGAGTFALQIAKYFGAEVTAVCSKGNIRLVKSLGADQVIDYNEKDFTKIENRYDIVFDAIGKSSFSKCKNIMKKNALYLSTLPSFELIFQMLLTSIGYGKKAKFSIAEFLNEDLTFIKELLAAGTIKTVIDKRYKLSQVAQAHKYAELGHAKGKVIITFKE